MKQKENNDDFRFPSFEALGDISATARKTQRNWRQLFAGIILTGFIMAAMMPVALVQEIRGLQPGLLEDQLIEAAGWWEEKTTQWNLDLPARGLRQYIENRSQDSWQASYCAFRARGIFDESSFFPQQLLENEQDTIVCE